jgi:hypothetical protein
MLARSLVLFAIAGFLVVPFAVQAGSHPTPVPQATAQEGPRDAGVLDGHITSVDYAANTMRVEVRGRGLLNLSVKPTTPITALDGGNAMMIDLKPRAHVVIQSNRTGDQYVAQNIKIVK